MQPSDPARSREALAQQEFLTALVTGAPTPAGFDAELVAHQAAALIRKQARLVANEDPALALSLGTEFDALFVGYARENPLRTGDRTGDTRRFARWLESNGPTSAGRTVAGRRSARTD